MKEHSRIACRFLIFKQTGVSHLVSLVRGILFFFPYSGVEEYFDSKVHILPRRAKKECIIRQTCASSVKEYFVFLVDCFASSDNNSTTRLPFHYNTIIAVSLSITLFHTSLLVIYSIHIETLPDRTNFQTKVRSSIDPFNVYFSLKVADHVIMMDCYSARDVTNQALVSNLRVLLSVMVLP